MPEPVGRTTRDSDEGSSYRASLTEPSAVREYATRYTAGSYDSFLWRLEREWLEATLDAHGLRSVNAYLDFACGTGRVLAALEDRAYRSVGVDISQAMLELARDRVNRAELVLGDASVSHRELDEEFELITAFRFILNAEDSLRASALHTIRDLLAKDGLLVVQVHGNTMSLRAPGALIARTLLRRPVRQLSHAGSMRLLRRHGYEPIAWGGFGITNRSLYRALGERRAARLEATVARHRLLQRFCVDLVYVCVKSPVSSSATSSIDAAVSKGDG